MEALITHILVEGRVFTVATVAALSGVSLKLLKRTLLVERDKLEEKIRQSTDNTAQLTKEIEELRRMNIANMQRISLLTERDETRAAEYISLKSRIDTLDSRIEALSRDIHTGISEIKTLIIHQRSI
ncbi:cell division protein zapB [Caudoviricetes sp.]|nr:cell division protein zapB [Caudoviricetes sp.]